MRLCLVVGPREQELADARRGVRGVEVGAARRVDAEERVEGERGARRRRPVAGLDHLHAARAARRDGDRRRGGGRLRGEVEQGGVVVRRAVEGETARV